MNKLKHFIPGRILYTLYCTSILLYINCGILIWGNTCKVYLDKHIKLQKGRSQIVIIEVIPNLYLQNITS